MIGRLIGSVAAEEPTGSVIVDVQGVGYEVMTPVGTIGRARVGAGPQVELWIHTHVREDALDLFGFANDADRRVFRLLISVPNVGPKTALGVLSAMAVADLAKAVQASDHARLGKIPGIGKKTAERLVLELKGKLPQFEYAGADPRAEAPSDQAARLLSALTNMGYRPAEAERAIATLGNRVKSDSLGDLLREALGKLSP
jgi:Holliday junction DNA helicase RuvA